MNEYTSGTLVRSSAAFTDINGAATDPDTITLKYKSGSSATVTAVYPASPVIKDSTGDYHADFDTTGFAGPDTQLWITQWAGSGAVTAIGDDSFGVTPPSL